MVIGTATTFGHGPQTSHTTGEVGRGLTTGRSGTPTTVARRGIILRSDAATGEHTGKSWVVVRVEAVFFDFLAAFFFGGLVGLALTPEEDRGKND